MLLTVTEQFKEFRSKKIHYNMCILNSLLLDNFSRYITGMNEHNMAFVLPSVIVLVTPNSTLI